MIVTSLQGWDLPKWPSVCRQELAGQMLHSPEDIRGQLFPAESEGPGESVGAEQNGRSRRRRISAERRGHRHVSAPEAAGVSIRLNDVLF